MKSPVAYSASSGYYDNSGSADTVWYGGKLYVANGRSNSVSVIDTETNEKLRDIAVGELPWGVVIR